MRHPDHRPVPNTSSSELPQKFVAPECDGLSEQNKNSRHDRMLSLSPNPRLCSPFFKARAFVHCTNSTGYVSESGLPPFSRVDPCSCLFPISNLVTLAEVEIFTKQALFRHLTCIWQFSRVQLPPPPHLDCASLSQYVASLETTRSLASSPVESALTAV